MSTNHETTVAELKFNAGGGITPVIKALFSVFDVQEFNGPLSASVSIESEGSDRSMESIAGYIRDFSGDLGLSLTEDSDTTTCFLALIEKFGANDMEDSEWAYYLPGGVDDDGCVSDDATAELSQVFDLALLLDDGHGLKSMAAQTSWGSNKTIVGEFGGSGEFRTSNIWVAFKSQWAEQIGGPLDDALATGNVDAAADEILMPIIDLLESITNDDFREKVAAIVAARLPGIMSPSLSKEG